MGLMDYTAVELGKKIKAGEVSVLEAANAAMDAIDALEDKFNCYVTVQERAAVQAKAEELQKKIDDGTLTGPLAGVPVAVKDNMCTKGTRTTCSSKILENFEPAYTAEAVLNLEKAGALLLVRQTWMSLRWAVQQRLLIMERQRIRGMQNMCQVVHQAVLPLPLPQVNVVMR